MASFTDERVQATINTRLVYCLRHHIEYNVGESEALNAAPSFHSVCGYTTLATDVSIHYSFNAMAPPSN